MCGAITRSKTSHRFFSYGAHLVQKLICMYTKVIWMAICKVVLNGCCCCCVFLFFFLSEFCFHSRFLYFERIVLLRSLDIAAAAAVIVATFIIGGEHFREWKKEVTGRETHTQSFKTVKIYFFLLIFFLSFRTEAVADNGSYRTWFVQWIEPKTIL